MYWLHFALWQDNVWLAVDTPPPKRRRKWTKRSRLDNESDKQTILSPKHLKASSSGDENVSFIASYSSSSSEEEVCLCIFMYDYILIDIMCVCLSIFIPSLQEGMLYRKPDEAEVLFGGTEKTKSGAPSKSSPAQQQKNRKTPTTGQQQSQKKYDYRSHSW